VASVAAVKDKLTALGCQVVILSFGVREGAERWKTDTQCPFPVYLDQGRSAYHSYGMLRSLSKCWSRGTRTFLVGVLFSGRKLVTPYQDIEDDPLQMGGDVLLRSDGSAVTVYKSQFPPDRPNISKFMDLMQNAN